MRGSHGPDPRRFSDLFALVCNHRTVGVSSSRFQEKPPAADKDVPSAALAPADPLLHHSGEWELESLREMLAATVQAQETATTELPRTPFVARLVRRIELFDAVYRPAAGAAGKGAPGASVSSHRHAGSAPAPAVASATNPNSRAGSEGPVPPGVPTPPSASTALVAFALRSAISLLFSALRRDLCDPAEAAAALSLLHEGRSLVVSLPHGSLHAECIAQPLVADAVSVLIQ